MRILLIHQSFVAPQEAGGTRHYEMATRLVQHGHEFTIVASDVSYLSGKKCQTQSRLLTEETLDGVRVLRAYTFPSLHAGFFGRLLSFFSFMFTSIWAGYRAGPVDLVIGTSPSLFQAFSAWCVSVLRWRPFVLEVRDLWPEFAIDMGVLRNGLLITLARWLERFLYSRASHIVVNSPAFRGYLLKHGVPADKISFIANGVDPQMFAGPTKSLRPLRAEYGLQGKILAVYTGALGIANDIQTILQAAKILQNDTRIHFLLVGDGKDRARLESLSDEMQLSNVTFTGVRSKAEMPAVLGESDICIATLQDIPMFRTTYPNKIFDYMAAGRPIVLAIDGVIREVVEAANAGIFVSPGDAYALAGAVKTLSNDPDFARHCGQSGKVYVTKHFDRNQHAQQLNQLVVGYARRQAA
jgi:glycosyltransferase involved in cell wall biosynthesis